MTNGHVDASIQEAVMGVTLTADDASDGDTPEAQVTVQICQCHKRVQKTVLN